MAHPVLLQCRRPGGGSPCRRAAGSPSLHRGGCGNPLATVESSRFGIPPHLPRCPYLGGRGGNAGDGLGVRMGRHEHSGPALDWRRSGIWSTRSNSSGGGTEPHGAANLLPNRPTRRPPA